MDCRTVREKSEKLSIGREMKLSEPFLKLMRSKMAFDLFMTKPNPFRLLLFIAYTLDRDGSPNLYGCKKGESRVGYKICGLTDSEYRVAKQYLQEMGLAEFFTRGKGKGQKAYARLTNTNIFDPNITSKETEITQPNLRNNDAIELSKTFNLSHCKSDNYDHEINARNPINNAIASYNQQDHGCKINKEQENKSKEPRRKNSRLKQSSHTQAPTESLALAELLYQSIHLIFPNIKKPTDLNGWAMDIERIIRIDKRSYETVKEVIKYLPRDAFWCKNVLSGSKLRKQFEKLEQAKLENEIRRTTSPNRFASEIAWAKQQFRPIFENNRNALFSFEDELVIIGDKRHDQTNYTKIYFSSYGFEDQLDNALRKWGLK